MNYKAHMHPMVSAAELTLFQALSSRNLTQGMTTQQPILLAQTEDGQKVTLPDFLWAEKHLAVFLDGKQCHSSDRAQAWDQEVDYHMEKLGYTVLRFSYDPPLNKTRLEEILEAIKEALHQ